MEERALGKLEATLGLSFLAVLVGGLAWAYVYQLDAPVPVTQPDPNWRSAQVEPVPDTAVKQTSYRPEWLSSESEEQPALVH
jgi:hypothetical protein